MLSNNLPFLGMIDFDSYRKSAIIYLGSVLWN